MASNKQYPVVSEHSNPYEVGALPVLQAFLSEEELSINRKLRSATNSRQAHSNNAEHGSRAEHSDGNERSLHQRWGYRQIDRHSSSRRHYDTHKQGQERGQRPRYNSRQTSGQHVSCYEFQRTGHAARFCPGRSTQSNSQATNGTHHSGSNVMKTSSDSSDNCKRKLRINLKGDRVTFQIRGRHPFLQHRPRIHKAKGLVI